MPSEWTCTNTPSTTECVVTATTSLDIGVYDGPNLQEWLFVAIVFLFFLSFMTWGRFFRPLSEVAKE